MSTPLPTRLVQAAVDAVAKVQNVPFPGRKQEKIARAATVAVLRALDDAADEFLIAGDDLPCLCTLADEIEGA